MKTLVPQGFSALTSYTKATPATTPTTPYSGNLCAKYQCTVHICIWRQQKRCRQERNGVVAGVVMGVVTDRTILAACTKGSVQNSVCSIHIFEIPIAQLLTILFRRILRNKKRAGKYNISFAIKMLSCVSNGEDPEEASACAEFYTSWNGDCGDVNRCAIADYASQMHPFVVGNCPPQNSVLSYSFYIRQWFSRFLPSQDHSIHKKRRLWDHMTPLWIIDAPAVSCAGGSCAGSCAGAQPDRRDRSSIAALIPCV